MQAFWLLSFGARDTDIVVDEVEVVSGCDGHSPAPSLEKTRVGLVQSLVDVHEGIDDGLAVGGRLGHFREHHREKIRAHILEGRGGKGRAYTEIRLRAQGSNKSGCSLESIIVSSL